MAHRALSLSPVVALLLAAPLFAPRVHAAEGRSLFGQPVHEAPELTPEELEQRAQEFREGLERQGLVLQGRQVLPKSALEPYFRDPEEPVAAWEEPPHRATTFLNFFGGPLTNGTNASESQSPCVGGGKVDYPGYNGTEQKALAIIQVFKDAAAPFGLRIAYEKAPPKHLPYSQVMMGGKPGVIGLPQGVLGVACNLDCGDTWWRDTTFAFTDESNDVNVLGTTALQEAAHAWGLDHIDGANNIMYPYATPGNKVWADTCTPYNAATGGIGCQHIHDKFCGGGSQNDVAELTAFFGVNSVDSEPPTVKMLSPSDGQEYAKGESVHVEVEVSDNHLGYGWRLMVPELGQEQPVYNNQTIWELGAPPKGEYTIRVEAVDHDGNVGFGEAKIYVDTKPTMGGETGGETDDPTTGDPSGGSSGGGGEESSDTAVDSEDTAPVDSKDDGCSCRSDAPIAGASWLLALAGGLLLRRRRA